MWLNWRAFEKRIWTLKWICIIISAGETAVFLRQMFKRFHSIGRAWGAFIWLLWSHKCESMSKFCFEKLKLNCNVDEYLNFREREQACGSQHWNRLLLIFATIQYYFDVISIFFSVRNHQRDFHFVFVSISNACMLTVLYFFLLFCSVFFSRFGALIKLCFTVG